MRSDPITSIATRNLCTGCGACAGAFPDLIRMIEDPTHGRRPVVAQTPAGRDASRAAVQHCAGAETDWNTLNVKDQIDAAWGPVLSAWEGWAVDPDIRYKGSSGGAVTALSAFALSSNTAKGVAHIAARTDDPRLNEVVISRDKAGLLRGTGSRYAQASPCEALATIASGNDPIAFVGKPCDAASVHKAAAQNPQLARKIPLTIAIFCAGAPNLAATGQLLDRLGVPKTARLTNLRYRGQGWPGLMLASWTDASGTEHYSEGIPYGEGWGRILQASRRWRCRVCADHTGAFADISVGDPWHSPPNGDTDAGRSLIVARTDRGQGFVHAAIQAGVLIAEPRSRDVIAKAQPNLMATNGAVWGRRLAMRAIGLTAPRDEGRRLIDQWLALPLQQKAQSILGTWKRAWRERLWRPVILREPNK